MLKFCILDNNINVVNKLSSMLETIFINNNFDAEISYKFTNAKDFLSSISTNTIDVLLIDVELKYKLTGIEIAKQIRKSNKNCYIIFITGHLEYGLIAYKCKTFDFLSKPITLERLEETIIRLFDDINGNHKIFIKLDNKNTIIEQQQIDYIKRDGMKIVFHTNSRDYQIYSSFNKLQEKLPNNFVRCHKSFIANINNITKVEPISNIVYFNDDSCDIGPKYKNNFMEVINHYANS